MDVFRKFKSRYAFSVATICRRVFGVAVSSYSSQLTRGAYGISSVFLVVGLGRIDYCIAAVSVMSRVFRFSISKHARFLLSIVRGLGDGFQVERNGVRRRVLCVSNLYREYFRGFSSHEGVMGWLVSGGNYSIQDTNVLRKCFFSAFGSVANAGLYVNDLYSRFHPDSDYGA